MKGTDGRDRCGVTGKDRFPDRDAALNFIKGYAGAKGARTAYWCVFCSGYHTSKNARGNRRGKA
jgi:hypothetical protein